MERLEYSAALIRQKQFEHRLLAGEIARAMMGSGEPTPPISKQSQQSQGYASSDTLLAGLGVRL